MYRILNFLHVLTAIVVIGWLAMQSTLVPRAVRQGAGQLETVRFSLRATKVLTLLSLLVYAFGIAMVLTGDVYDFGETWLNISMLLYFVLLAVLWLFVRKVQATVVERWQQGQDASDLAGKLSMWGGVVNLLVLVIVWLMVTRPA